MIKKYKIPLKPLGKLCIACLLVMSLLTGCGKESLFNGSRVCDETGFRMEYTVLNRIDTADMELSEGEELRVVIAHTAGNVDVTVGQPGKEPIYRGTGQTNAEFILTIPETGSYRISVTGHRANGKVSFIRLDPKAEP